MQWWSVLFTFIIFSSCCFANKSYVKIQQWQTKNHVSVYFVKINTLPILDVSTVFHAGSAYDGKQGGLASLTNQFIGQQTTDLNTTQIANAINSLGINFDSTVNRDMAVVHMRTLSREKYLKPAIDFYTKLLTKMTFSTATFSRVKAQTISDIQSSLQNPYTIAGITFYNELYGNTPYAHPIDGTTHSITGISANDVTSFYKNYYNANNALIVIIGDTTKNQAKSVAEMISTQLPAGKAYSLPKINIQPHNKTYHVDFNSPQSTIIIGQAAISRNNADYLPLQVGNTLLGNMGLTSILMKTVRNEHGLVYGISSAFNAWQQPGPFYIAFQTKNQTVQQAITLTKSSVANYLATGPSDQALQATKKYLIGSFPFSYATNQNILDNVVNIAFYNLPLNYLDTYQNRISKTTAQSIKQAFDKTIKPENLITVIVGEK